jgi:putative DNA primase/helicase
LDDCRDPDSGDLTAFARDILDRFRTYAEVSPSGTGVKLFVRGEWKDKGKRKDKGCDKIEVYGSGRYFAVTGHVVEGAPSKIADCQAELDALHAELFAAKSQPSNSRNGNGRASHKPTGHDRARVIERARKYVAKMDPAISGQRGHDRTYHVACTLILDFGLNVNEAFPVIAEWNAACQPPWSEADLRRKLAEADKLEDERGTLLRTDGENGRTAHRRATVDRPWKAPGTPQRVPLTDLGNARRLVAAHGNDIRFCHHWGDWLSWDGTRWRLDESGEIVRRAKSVVDAMWAEVPATAEVERTALAKHVITSSRSDRISAMVKLAQSEPGVPVSPNDLDQNLWLLNCPNGTVDLQTGELGPHRREDLLTKCTAARFNLDAQSHVWDRFLESVFDGKDDLIQFVQRFFGYALCGAVLEHVLAVFHGRGANGKSTLLEAYMHALGPDYSTKGAPDLLLVKHGDVHPTERADLFGKRFIAAVESEDGRRLNESLVKELTGGDTVKARRMREDFWSFRPTLKIALCTNHRPTVRGTDHGIWRRIRLVPFNQVFGADRQDLRMPDKLRAEAEGILAWAVRGCVEWQREGLGTAEAVTNATERYKTEQDVIGGFFTDRCVFEPTATVRARDLRNAYETWAADAGQSVLNPNRFAREITNRGAERFTNNGACYRGIGLLT